MTLESPKFSILLRKMMGHLMTDTALSVCCIPPCEESLLTDAEGNKVVGVRFYHGYATANEVVICKREPQNPVCLMLIIPELLQTDEANTRAAV